MKPCSLCGVFLYLLGANLHAQTWFSGILPSSGPICASTYPIQCQGSNILAGTYVITLTDSANNTIFPIAAPVLDPNKRFINVLFDLTTLVTGPGTVSITPPSGPNYSFPFVVNTCPGSSGVVLQLYGSSTISTLHTWQFVLNVLNPGPGSSAAADVQVAGLPLAPDIVMNAPAGSILVNPTPTTQGFTVSVPSLPSGTSADFVFDLAPGVSASGFSYPLEADFISGYSGSYPLPIAVVASHDPNSKAGPLGKGAGHYLSGNVTLLPYTIDFENKATATAPAQQVKITDQLDLSRLDPSTFQFGPVTFGSELVNPPFGANMFTVMTYYSVDGNPAHDVVVQIDGSLDFMPASPTYGLVTWKFQSLDPSTGFPVFNPLVGFLPPNVTPPQGQGTVSFTISPQPGLTSGNRITNGATIFFDANAPIATPIWTNTIDNTPPSSQVNGLPPKVPTTFAVTWGGVDADSGIADYDIFVSDNGAAFQPWLSATSLTFAQYSGVDQHTYSFYSVARDLVGNQEIAPVTPEATTTAEALFPTIQIAFAAGQVTVTWANGLLQQSNIAGGPFVDAAVQTSPWTFIPAGPVGFFRVRQPQ